MRYLELVKISEGGSYKRTRTHGKPIVFAAKR